MTIDEIMKQLESSIESVIKTTATLIRDNVDNDATCKDLCDYDYADAHIHATMLQIKGWFDGMMQLLTYKPTLENILNMEAPKINYQEFEQLAATVTWSLAVITSMCEIIQNSDAQ